MFGLERFAPSNRAILWVGGLLALAAVVLLAALGVSDAIATAYDAKTVALLVGLSALVLVFDAIVPDWNVPAFFRLHQISTFGVSFLGLLIGVFFALEIAPSVYSQYIGAQPVFVPEVIIEPSLPDRSLSGSEEVMDAPVPFVPVPQRWTVQGLFGDWFTPFVRVKTAAARWDMSADMKIAAIALAVLLVARFASLLFFWMEPRELGRDKDGPQRISKQELERLVLRVRTRATFLKVRALMSLVLVVVVLAAGGAFIFYAGQLIEEESKGESKFSQLTTIRAEHWRVAESFREEIGRLDLQVLDYDYALQAVEGVTPDEMPAFRPGPDATPLNSRTVEAWSVAIMGLCTQFPTTSEDFEENTSLCPQDLKANLEQQIQTEKREIRRLGNLRSNYQGEADAERLGLDGRSSGEGDRYREFVRLATEAESDQFKAGGLLVALNEKLETVDDDALQELERKLARALVGGSLRPFLMARGL